MTAGKLDRRIQLQRRMLADDGLQQVEVWANHGAPIWAGRRDISDAERAQAGWIEATVVSRFMVRSSSFSRDLTAKDRILAEGSSYDIQGIKQLDRRGYLEITAVARDDL